MQNTPLHPIADWGRQRFGGSDVSAEKRLADLENLLALVKLDPVENAALLAPLLDIPLPPERVMAEELQRRQLAALTSLVMTGTRAQPAVLAARSWAFPSFKGDVLPMNSTIKGPGLVGIPPRPRAPQLALSLGASP